MTKNDESAGNNQNDGTRIVDIESDLLRRQPSTSTIDEGLDSLHEELAAFATLFHAGKVNQRQAIWRSIAAVTQFLLNAGVPYRGDVAAQACCGFLCGAR